MKANAFSIVAAVAATMLQSGVACSQPATTSKPDLVVLLAVDQFSALLFDKWRSIATGGLKRIVAEGIVYNNAYQSHAITETCAGHSTLLTGKHPGRTGIVANEWFDPESGKEIYCVADAAYSQAHSASARKVGPALLATSTLGDWLKEQQPSSRVAVVSGKDRASITMAGRRADAVFWYEDNFGFTTFVGPNDDASAKLAPLAKLNARIQAEAKTPQEWTYFNEACRSLEADYRIGNVTWRSKLPPEIPAEDGKPVIKIRPVQIIDPLILEAARELTAAYQLGKRGVTDLLAISLSATDFVGHGYGTQGPEMCDQMYRLDAQIGDFLTFLDPSGIRILLVLTGDHGGSDFSERLAQQGYAAAKRINGRALLAGINAELKAKLSLTDDPLVSSDLVQYYVVGKDRKRLDDPVKTKVIQAAVEILSARAEVEAAFTLQELLSHKIAVSAASDLSLKDRFAQSAMAGRSGDIIVAFKSGISTAPTLFTRFIMGHSGPYRTDTGVPIIFSWHGAKPVTRSWPTDTTIIAPTLANIMGISAPSDLDGACIDIGYPDASACPR
jgi:predicted AlkP superfamily pyrophosphatase or phosphodiesterase